MQEDNYYPHGKLQRLMWDSVYYLAEPLLSYWPFNKIRERAVKKAIEHIHYEDENSRYITIGCVEKVQDEYAKTAQVQDVYICVFVCFVLSYLMSFLTAINDACLLGR